MSFIVQTSGNKRPIPVELLEASGSIQLVVRNPDSPDSFVCLLRISPTYGVVFPDGVEGVLGDWGFDTSGVLWNADGSLCSIRDLEENEEYVSEGNEEGEGDGAEENEEEE